MPVMLIAFDESGKLVVWNRECERITGYPAAELVDNPQALTRLIPDEAQREHILAEWSGRAESRLTAVRLRCKMPS